MTVGLIISLILNLHLYNISIPKKEPVYIADVELVDRTWEEYSQNTENNLYYVDVTITLVNYGNSSAYVAVTYSMCELGGDIIYDFRKTESGGISTPVVYTLGYTIYAETTRYYNFHFYYQKPENTTYLKTEITEVSEI